MKEALRAHEPEPQGPELERYPLVTIGMPTHNAERFVAESIESVLSQDYPNWVLRINDNGSTDSTPEICKRFAESDARVSFSHWPQNRGAAANFTFLMQAAQGEYFQWAADHDLWHPSFISRLVLELQSNQHAVLAYPQTVLIDADGHEIQHIIDAVDLDLPCQIERYLQLIWHLNAGNMIYGLMRTSAIRDVGAVPTTTGSDLVVLGHLALQGMVLQVEQPMFFRRRNREPEEPHEQLRRALSMVSGSEVKAEDFSVTEGFRDMRDHHLRLAASQLRGRDLARATFSIRICFRERFGVPSRMSWLADRWLRRAFDGLGYSTWIGRDLRRSS